MIPFLFVVPFKAGRLEAYRKFAAEITGPRKKEYAEMMKRYGLKSTRVWIQTIGGKEYAVVYHDAEEGAADHLKRWKDSLHPFDVWFKEQLGSCYDSAIEPAQHLFDFYTGG